VKISNRLLRIPNKDRWEDTHCLNVLQSRVDFIQQDKGPGVLPDIFLLDIQMKPYDGLDLLSMLRKDPEFKSSKVIALTVSVTNEEVSLLKTHGYDSAMAKPLNIEVFPDLLARIFNGEQVWRIA